jgi:hypothetical protein
MKKGSAEPRLELASKDGRSIFYFGRPIDWKGFFEVSLRLKLNYVRGKEVVVVTVDSSDRQTKH